MFPELWKERARWFGAGAAGLGALAFFVAAAVEACR